MKIIFARHGNPNYALDCLTELGHVQAAAAAERLADEGIEAIYSSSCGRALETAGYTASKIGLEVHPCDFIREIDWAPKDKSLPAEQGNPWGRARKFVESGRSAADLSWREDALFAETEIPESLDKLALGLDGWLETLGYKREGFGYRVGKVKYKTVAMFCHAGAFAAAFSHLFGVGMPYSLICIPFNQTGIVEIELPGKLGELSVPRFIGGGNVRHLAERNIEIT